MNENIYTGSLGRRLWLDGLLMEGPLTVTSQVSGGNCRDLCDTGYHVYQFVPIPTRAEIGDHRFQIHDFDAHLVLGMGYPMTVRPFSRALRCKVARTVNNYNKVLEQLLV